MAHRDIIVIGASAGGIDSITRLLSHLPEDFSAAIFVSFHFVHPSSGILTKIISHCTKLQVKEAASGQKIEGGFVYVCPPDHHLIVEHGNVKLTHGAKENGFRPSIDALFRSAAAAYGNRVIGILLSGLLADGVAG